ncbi:hypothetical protein WN48_01920 [Eufriesea mexicana]|uniref:Uncharacterized protein n=1 Tax=Eufriesea mexicana TaxID=516756 RepID=A0A310SKV5_9HYME|nr:hypothetical protein WN48_01920 [Eufriesea mexicana]
MSGKRSWKSAMKFSNRQTSRSEDTGNEGCLNNPFFRDKGWGTWQDVCMNT